MRSAATEIHYSTFTSYRTSDVVRACEERSAFVAKLLTHTHTEDKFSGPLFSPVLYSPRVTRRGKAGIESASALVFDIEAKGTSPVDQADLDRILKGVREHGWEAVVYSTHSHTPASFRLRLTLFLSRSVTPPEFAPLRAIVRQELALDGLADPAAEDISRIFFWPAAPPGGERIATHVQGGDVDVDELLVDTHVPPFVGAVERNVPEGWTYTRPAPYEGPVDIAPLRALMIKYRGGGEENPNTREYKTRLIQSIRKGERFANQNYREAILRAVGVMVRLFPNVTREEVMAVMRDSLHATYDGGHPISYDEACAITQDIIEKDLEKYAAEEVAWAAWTKEEEGAAQAKREKLVALLSGPAPQTTADLTSVMQEYDPPTYVYCVATQQYVFPDPAGYFPTQNQIGKDAIEKYLLEHGEDFGEVKKNIKRGTHTNIYGWDFAPRMPPLFIKEKHFWANTWRPSPIIPVEGVWPTIDAVLDSLTYNNVPVDPQAPHGTTVAGYDTAGKDWLVNWLAYAVRFPASVPGTAVLVNGVPQGSGKNTLNYIMQQILGPDNCGDITNNQLESRFNSRWIGKCFVFGDEIYNREANDITDKLKNLVTAATVNSEAKGRNEVETPNRAKYLFASNNPAPLRLDKGDRRFAVFTRHAPVQHEYALRLQALFTGDARATPEFAKEIAAFSYYLERYPASLERARRAYSNPSKQALIDANTPTYQLFFEHVDTYGIDDMVRAVLLKARRLTFLDDVYTEADDYFGPWDFGNEGVAFKVVYQCYVHFTQERQNKPLGAQKFGNVLQGHPTWVRKTLGPQNKRVVCNEVKRTLLEGNKPRDTPSKEDANPVT